ncbi:hypothetical protein C8J56DRAFT_1156922 [Mycena floridula]|nr:hypothetical protein C8J56DRAFT_1156922 [Mycena floridula]
MVPNASFNVREAGRPIKDLHRELDHGRVRQDPSSSGLGYIPLLGDHPADLDMQIFYPSVPHPSSITNGPDVPFTAAPRVSQSLSTLKRDSGNMLSAPSDGKRRVESSSLPVAPKSTSSPIPGPSNHHNQSNNNTINAGSQLNNQAGIPGEPFKCTQCSDRFARPDTLKRHLEKSKKHGNSGKYLCPGCHTEYTRKDSVPRHQRNTGCSPGNPKPPTGPACKW